MIDVEEYLKWARRRRNPTTLAHHAKILGYLRAHLAASGATFSPESVDGWLTTLFDRGLTANSIYTYWEVVRQYAKYTGRIEEFKDIEAPRPDQTVYQEFKVMSVKDMQLLVTRCPVLRDRAILAVLTDLGLRRGEVCLLDIDDIDLKTSIIRVKRLKRRGQMRIDAVPIRSRLTKRALRDYLRWRCKQDVDTDALFISKRDTRIHPGTVYTIVRKWSSRILGRQVHPHELRHGVASQIVAKTGSVKVVADYIGTTSGNAERYSHLTSKQIRDVLPDPYQ